MFGVGADTADCIFLERGGSVLLPGLPLSLEFDVELFVELQLLGLRECERDESPLSPPQDGGVSDPDLINNFLFDFFEDFLITTISSLFELRRSKPTS